MIKDPILMLKCNIGKFLSKPTLGFRKRGEEDGKFSNYNKKEGHKLTQNTFKSCSVPCAKHRLPPSRKASYIDSAHCKYFSPHTVSHCIILYFQFFFYIFPNLNLNLSFWNPNFPNFFRLSCLKYTFSVSF